MTISHHPDDATLMSHAAGSLGEALSAVVAAHVEMCPRCSGELVRMERIGAALFETLAPAPLATPRAADAPPQLPVEKPLPRQHLADSARGTLPPALRRLTGGDLDRVAWKRLGIGIWQHPLPLSQGAKGTLRLLKVAPGLAMPEHGHGGSELTLLLRGSYSDEVGTFRTGDLADLDETVAHSPVADAVDGCICLIASVEPAKFRSLLARLLQPLTGF